MVKKIMWDKGHGGSDPGAVGNGLQEKVLTNKIVNYAINHLTANYMGFEQRTTRTGDQSISLSQRSNLANNWGADVFVSVHINAGGGTGFETFIFNGGAPSSTITLQNMIHSEVLTAMRSFGTITDRGKKRANFAVLNATNMDAILTENLFIDTKADADKLKNEDFLKSVGEAHARGVAKFLGLNQKVNAVENRVENTSVQNEWKVVKVTSSQYGLYSVPGTKWKEDATPFIGWIFVVREKQVVNGQLWYHLYLGDASYGWISASLVEEVPYKWANVREDTPGYLHSDLEQVASSIPAGSKIAIIDEHEDKFLVVSSNRPQWVRKKIVQL